MIDSVQVWLLLAAVIVLIIMFGMHSYLLLRLMGDVEKFGRLLLKLRRHEKTREQT